MTKITNIDRGTLRMIEQRVNAALKDLGDELGIDFSYAGGSYGIKAQLKLNLTVRDTGTGESSDQAALSSLGADGDNLRLLTSIRPNPRFVAGHRTKPLPFQADLDQPLSDSIP